MNPTASPPGASVRGRTHVHTPGKAGPDLGGCWVGMRPPHSFHATPDTHNCNPDRNVTSDWLIRDNWSVNLIRWNIADQVEHSAETVAPVSFTVTVAVSYYQAIPLVLDKLYKDMFCCFIVSVFLPMLPCSCVVGLRSLCRSAAQLYCWFVYVCVC